MNLKTKCLVLIFALGAAISTTQAHHSPPPLGSENVEVKGVLRSAELLNPHSVFRVEARDAAGNTVDWVFEGQPPAWYRKAGIKKTDFSKGVDQQVTVTARVARDGKPFGIMSKITFADGTYVGS